jgi:hypothetical protein
MTRLTQYQQQLERIVSTQTNRDILRAMSAYYYFSQGFCYYISGAMDGTLRKADAPRLASLVLDWQENAAMSRKVAIQAGRLGLDFVNLQTYPDHL